MNLETKDHIKKEVKLLKECIIDQEEEIGKLNDQIRGHEAEIRSYERKLKGFSEGLRKADREELGLDNIYYSQLTQNE